MARRDVVSSRRRTGQEPGAGSLSSKIFRKLTVRAPSETTTRQPPALKGHNRHSLSGHFAAEMLGLAARCSVSDRNINCQGGDKTISGKG